MANLRVIKKDIDYLVNEVIEDCYISLYFNQASKAEIVGIMEEAVALRNTMFVKVNNPAEKHNKSLVKKHYQQVRLELIEGINGLFEKLSSVCKAK